MVVLLPKQKLPEDSGDLRLRPSCLGHRTPSPPSRRRRSDLDRPAIPSARQRIEAAPARQSATSPSLACIGYCSSTQPLLLLVERSTRRGRLDGQQHADRCIAAMRHDVLLHDEALLGRHPQRCARPEHVFRASARGRVRATSGVEDSKSARSWPPERRPGRGTPARSPVSPGPTPRFFLPLHREYRGVNRLDLIVQMGDSVWPVPAPPRSGSLSCEYPTCTGRGTLCRGMSSRPGAWHRGGCLPSRQYVHNPRPAENAIFVCRRPGRCLPAADRKLMSTRMPPAGIVIADDPAGRRLVVGPVDQERFDRARSVW